MDDTTLLSPAMELAETTSLPLAVVWAAIKRWL